MVETEWGPYTKKARDSAKAKGIKDKNLRCRAAQGGGQTCEGSIEIEFTKAYDTKDGAVSAYPTVYRLAFSVWGLGPTTPRMGGSVPSVWGLGLRVEG